jgi:uncharacterized protein
VNLETVDRRARRRLLFITLAVGVGAGFLSGLFGVGGGVIIVPALVTFLAFDQRRAAGTSLLAIAPSALVGAVTYGVHGQVHLPATVFLVTGGLLGSPLGTHLLRRLPGRVQPWIFVGFVAMVITSFWIVTPTRHGAIDMSWGVCVGLFVIGSLAGVLSGLVGVGGGVVVVPGMEVVVGAGDLIAKGTSLVMMLPTALSGTIANSRHSNIDVRVGVMLGTAAVAGAPLGVFAAAAIPPEAARFLFAAFLSIMAFQVIWRSKHRRRRAGSSASAYARTGSVDS